MGESRSCVVTGSAGGIGREIASLLLENGWSVVGLDLVDSSQVVRGATSANFVSVSGDVAEASAHRRAASTAETLAPLQGWVNCAGYNILGTVADLPETELRRGVEVDLLGVFLGTAEAARRFLDVPVERRTGAIVNISSIQASVGFPGFAAYAMCKGGIESLTRQVAGEYVAAGIRCNAVAPGLVESPMNADILNESNDEDEVMWRWGQLTPMGRWGQPRDIASAVSFLLSSDASYITGQILAVNGGALALAPGQGSR